MRRHGLLAVTSWMVAKRPAILSVAQPGTLGLAPVHSAPHLSLSPGGFTCFDGGIDGARAVFFDPGESPAAVLNVLQGVPEPSSVARLGLGGLVALRRRRTVA